MSRYIKKTDRPYRYPSEARARWVAHALRVSIEDAARVFGVAHETVRRHLRAAGHKPRRPGNFTKAEIAAMGRAA